MSFAEWFLEPKDLIAHPSLSIIGLLFHRALLPALWLIGLSGLARILGRQSHSLPLVFRVAVGAVLFILPIYLCQVFGLSLNGYALTALLALGLLVEVAHFLLDTKRPWNLNSWILPAILWSFFLLVEAGSRLPAFGDPLAFLIYAKELVRFDFQWSLLDHHQRFYPDLLVNHLAGFAMVFRQDPIDSLMAITPVIGAGAVLSWLGLSRQLVLGSSKSWSNWDLLAGLFIIAAARNPLRYGVVAGRYPYLTAFFGFTLLCWYCLDLRSRKRESPDLKASAYWFESVLTACLAGLVFLAHPSFLPLLIAPFVYLFRLNRRIAFQAGMILLGVVAPRAFLLFKELTQFSAGVEAVTPAWSSFSGVITGALLSARETWASIAVSPLCQGLFICSVAYLVWRRPRAGPLAGLVWPLVFILFWGASGLTETLGLKMFSSHYGARHLGILVMLILWAGWTALRKAEVVQMKPWFRVLLAVAMIGHVLALSKTFVQERSLAPLKSEARRIRADALRVIQSMIDEEKNRPGWIKGVVPPVVFNAVIPFGLVQGDVEYFPYFLPEKRLFLAFVPRFGLGRSIPKQVELARSWMANPADVEVVRQLKSHDLNLVWLPESGDFRLLLSQLQAAPQLYRLWRQIGREWVFELR